MHNMETDPHKILMDVYLKKTHSSFHRVSDPWNSERIQKMMEYIPESSFEFDKFNYNLYDRSLNCNFNFYDFVTEIDNSKRTIIFEAHHDVNNTRDGVMNLVDNTGSCSILLALANQLRPVGSDLPVNVVMSYCDLEELTNFELAGSRKLADRIKGGAFGDFNKVDVIVLEVSTRGKVKFVDQSKGVLAYDERFLSVETPFSDAFVLNTYGVSASCIGIMTEADADHIMAGEYGCDTWSACHTTRDNLSMVDSKDMREFVDFLKGWVYTL